MKKSKKEKRDGSTDSNDSESEGRKMLEVCFFNILFLIILFFLQERKGQENQRNLGNPEKLLQMKKNQKNVVLARILKKKESIQKRIKNLKTQIEEVNFNYINLIILIIIFIL